MRNQGFLPGLILWLVLLTIASCKQNSADKNPGDKDDSLLIAINASIEKDTKNPDLYLKRAQYYLDQERVNDALLDVTKTLELDPKSVKAYLVLSSANILLGKPQPALDALNQAVSISPDHIEAHLKKAQLYLVMKDYNNCAGSVQKVLELDPYNSDAFYIKGVVLDENKQTEKAILAFQSAVLYNPRHFDALMQLGYAYTSTNPSMAMDYFRNVLKIDSTNHEALYNLGMLYQENDQPVKALETYAIMIRNNPHDKLALYNSGYVNLVYLQKYDIGSSFFTRAISVDSAYADAWFNRGYCHELTGEYKLARENYAKVLILRENDTKAVEALNRLDKVRR
jgi:tetratricopeptide (TPR) repeat protein